MKKLLYFLLALIALSCTKVNDASFAPSLTKPNTNAYILPILNHTDSILLGNWVLDSISHFVEYYTINTPFIKPLGTSYFSDPTHCNLLLTPNFVLANDLDKSYWKGATNGLNCTNIQSVWKAENGYLILSGAYYKIIYFSTTKLVLTTKPLYLLGPCSQKNFENYYGSYCE